MRRVAIVGGLRIPFARSMGAYARHSSQEMLAAVFKALVERYRLQGEVIGDVGAGAVLKHSRDFNLTREAVLESGLSPRTPAFDLQRACGTSLETAIALGLKIASGQIESAIAGGVDSASDVPIAYPDDYREILLASARARTLGARLKPFFKLRLRHFKPQLPAIVEPRTGLSMGESCELMAREWGIERRAQDELALESHRKAHTAWQSGFYSDLVVPFAGLTQDNNIRADTSLERLGQLKPAFAKDGKGTLTAGNSTPMTDGAAAVLLASEDWARARNLPIQAYLAWGKTGAVEFQREDGLLMAPAYTVPRMLADAGLTLQDFDFYEIHEAFEAQVLCTLAAWESARFCRERLGLDRPLGSIDRSKLNIKGGSVAIGHPFAATGARIVATLAKLLAEQRTGRGLISICTAGGMGVAAILEGPEGAH
jgi:acetyl-CoA C-acetyltransferase